MRMGREDFLTDPQSPEWAIALAEQLMQEDKDQEAYDLLVRLAVAQPKLPDIQEKLADLAVELGLHAETVLGHVAQGLEALEAQGDQVDPKLREECRAHLQACRARALEYREENSPASSSITDQG